MPLAQLPSADTAPGVETAQRFLLGGYDSVSGLLQTFDAVRAARKALKGSIKGRVAESEADLLRAAVVFTGAALDSSLKRLIHDALPTLLSASKDAQKKFEEFASRRLGAGEFVEAKMAARYLTSQDPRERLIEDYIYELTGSSLQSAEQVKSVAGALGAIGSELYKEIGELRSLFIARNEISHELDLQRPEKQGDRSRRSRAINDTTAICSHGFVVGQHLINAVCPLLLTT